MALYPPRSASTVQHTLIAVIYETNYVSVAELAALRRMSADVIIVYDRRGVQKNSRSWYRKFKILKKIYYQKIAVAPKFYHDYPVLIRFCRGPIIRRSLLRLRPAVVRRHNSTNDRRINKRKFYLQSL